MPWGDNNKGQGPWGQNTPPKKPSNKPNGQKPGGDKQEPDLDELLRRAREHFRNILGNGGGTPGKPNNGVSAPTVAAFVVIGLITWLATGVYTVAPEEEAVVLRFGAFNRASTPGLHYHIPYPIEQVSKVPVTTINRVEVGVRSGVVYGRDGTAQERKVPEESLMLTGDENIVDVDFEVQWRVNDAKNFLFQMKDPSGTVKSAAESAMREVIGRTPIADALTEGRQKIEESARKILQGLLDSYKSGIEIVKLQLREVQPPLQVIDAFRDVQNAKSDKEAAINQAQTYRNDILPRARGEAERILQDSQAYESRTVSLAQGEAQRFTKIYDEYVKAKDVTRKRMYLDTMEEILTGMDKVILDNKAGAVPYLPINEINKRKVDDTVTTAPDSQ